SVTDLEYTWDGAHLTLYAGVWASPAGNSGIYESDDYGETWDLLDNTNRAPFGVDVARIAFASDHKDKIYAAVAKTGSDGKLFGVYETNDGGGTWARMPIPAGLFDDQSRMTYNLAFALSPATWGVGQRL